MNTKKHNSCDDITIKKLLKKYISYKYYENSIDHLYMTFSRNVKQIIYILFPIWTTDK